MSYARTLQRGLDLDLIAQIEASGRPRRKPKPSSKLLPRHHTTYRGYRRNQMKRNPVHR
jgi:hypothetical protein